MCSRPREGTLPGDGPSPNKSLISMPGPTEAIKLDLSDGAEDQRFGVLITEEKEAQLEKWKEKSPGRWLQAPQWEEPWWERKRPF